MLNLIITIPGGYCEREFKGFEHVLGEECRIITPTNFNEIKVNLSKDNFIVSDYYFHPFFKEEVLSEEFHSFIRTLPTDRTGIYCGDSRFTFTDPTKFTNWSFIVVFASQFEDFDLEKIKGDYRIFDNIKYGRICKMDIPAIAACSYSDSSTYKREKKYDFSYIINSQVLERKHVLDAFYKMDHLSLQLGNWPTLEDEDIQKFIEHRKTLSVETRYEDGKAFGDEFISLNGLGKYTFTVSNGEGHFAFPMRFSEAIRSGTLSFIHQPKDPNKRIFNSDWPLCNEFLYFNNYDELLEKIEIIEGCPALLKDLQHQQFRFLKKYLGKTRLKNNIKEALKFL